MGMPHAYDYEIAEHNADEMLDVLEGLRDEHCEDCEVGPIGRDLGYTCPGNCMDYAFEVQDVPYAFALEIYGHF